MVDSANGQDGTEGDTGTTREQIAALLAKATARQQEELEKLVRSREAMAVIPEYPVTGETKVVHLTREADFPAWVGRREQLLRLESTIEKALMGVYSDHVAGLEPGWEARIGAENAIRNLKLDVKVTAAQGHLQRTGGLASILADMDLSEIESIEIGNSGYSPERAFPKVTVTFASRDPYSYADSKPPVKVSVSGPDRQWVGGLFDLLSGEVAKGVPWWAFMRQPITSLTLGLLLGLGTFGWLLSRTNVAERGSAWEVLWMLTVLGALAGAVIIRPFLRRFFPALEVIEPGATPKGRTALGVAAGVLSFAVGVAGLVVGVMAL